MKSDYVVIAFVLGLLCLGLALPGYFWGISWFGFLSTEAVAILIALIVGIIGLYRSKYLPEELSNFHILLITVVAGIAYNVLNMAADLYGDSPVFYDTLISNSPKSYGFHLKLLFSPNLLHPGNDKITVLNLVQIIRKISGLDAVESFRIITTVCGMIYSAVWCFFVRDVVKEKRNRFVFVVIGLFAPVTFQFYGHIELYAPILSLTLLFFWLSYRYHLYKKNTYFWLSLSTVIVAMKFHITALLLIPALIIMAVTRYYKGNFTLDSWKKAFLILVLPVFTLGLILYFFVVGDYNDPRFLSADIVAGDRVFLPIVPPDPPLDRYHLFHPYHFLDILNMFLMWSVPAFLAVIWMIRKQVSSFVLLTASTFIIYVLFFFALNPLLGMSIDLDLFLLPAPILLVLVVTLYKPEKLTRFRSMILLITAVIGFSTVLLNTDKKGIGNWLITSGEYAYKSYWIRSAQTITDGVKLLKPDKHEYVSLYKGLIQDLEPYAVKGKDVEYADFAMQLGKFYRKNTILIDSAMYYHKMAEMYSPDYKPNLIGLMESFYIKQEYKTALNYAERLVNDGYPSKSESYKVAAVCAIKADDRKRAILYLTEYLKLEPEQQFFNKILSDLNSELNLKEIGDNFQ